jgi:UDP-N-acetylenolpyruvoylglucosamine reductase
MGMGPLAIYMRQEGWDVTGWDDAAQPPMYDFLCAAGVRLQKELPAVQRVGHSSAIKPEHPLRELASARNISLVRRGELLAERVRERRLIAVCGSHGKTTTSGMLAQALLAAGLDIGYVLGGLYRDSQLPPARVGKEASWVVAEIDESDGTISHFSPEITVAVNLDWDHPDYYRTEADLEAVFAALFQRTSGAIFIPASSTRLRRLAKGTRVPVFAIDIDAGENFNAANERMSLAVTRHVAGRTGEPPLGKYSGMRRRQDILFSRPGLRVMADYAHHPTEISALLRLLCLERAGGGRVVAIFQPHRHTRTRQYAQEFATALQIADAALLLPVYSAGEAPVEGGHTSGICKAVREDARFRQIENLELLAPALREELSAANGAPTTLVFIGAGDIDKAAAAFANTLRWETLAHPEQPLGSRTTLGVGGNCAWLAEPENVDDIRFLLRASEARGLPFFVVGRGSNLLVPDAGFPGLVIRLSREEWKKCALSSTDSLAVGAGVSLREIAAQAATAGLDGFAFLDGIPGTLGGALRMNAGAAGTAIFDRVVSITWLSPDGVLREEGREAFDARYRDCTTLHNGVVLGAVLRGTGQRAPREIQMQMRAQAELRRARQPQEPSAGSVYKNPPGAYAGQLIETAGLKGAAIGGAVVSEVHANFIVNKGGATAADVAALMRHVSERVRMVHGVELSPEITLLGVSTALSA